MKNGETLLRAFGNIDDKYIVECEKKEEKVVSFFEFLKKKNLTRIVGVAACLVLLITGGIIMNMGKIQNNENHKLVAIANPIMEVDALDDLQKYFNVDIPVLNKKVEEYIVIGTGGYADHARITYEDGTSFNMDLTYDDASGIFGGTVIKEEKLEGVSVKFYQYNTINYATWTKDGISYSYAVDNGVLSVEEIVQLLKP